MTGLQYDRPGVRIERMLESIAILRGLFGDGPVTFEGRHYRITDMDGRPKPVQQPHPPFLIGGTREKVLRIAAREADIVGLDLRQDGEAILDAFEARTDVRIGWIRDEVGDRIGALDINVLRSIGELSVTNEPLKVAADVARELAARTGRRDLRARRPRVAVLDDRVGPRSRREAPDAASALGHQLVPRRLVRTRRLRDLAPVIEQLSGT